LTILKFRINSRERRSKADKVRLAEEQGNDLIQAREECERRGSPHYRKWGKWLSENITEMCRARAYHYISFSERLVTRRFTPEEKWKEWQRISGNEPEDGVEQEVENEEEGAEDENEDGREPAEIESWNEPAEESEALAAHASPSPQDESEAATAVTKTAAQSRSSRDSSNDVFTVKFRLSKPQHARWKEIVGLSKKTFGVDSDSEAALRMGEDWLEMRGQVDA
jgi:hypothetical protein